MLKIWGAQGHGVNRLEDITKVVNTRGKRADQKTAQHHAAETPNMLIKRENVVPSQEKGHILYRRLAVAMHRTIIRTTEKNPKDVAKWMKSID